MNVRLKHKVFLITLSILIGLYLIYYIFTKIPFDEVWSLFKASPPIALFAFAGVSILIMVFHALRWQTIVASFGKRVPFKEIFLFKIVGFGISFITPAAKVGGEPLRAALLQRKGLSFNRSFSTVVIDKIIDLSTTGLLFVLAVVVALFTYALPKDMMILLIFLSIIFIILIVFVYYQMLNDKNLFLKLFKLFRLHKIKFLHGAEESIIEFERLIVDFHKKEKKAFYRSLVYTIFAWLLMFLEYQSVLWIFGVDTVSFQALFLIITVMGIAYLFPIPLALGVLEAGQLSLFSLLSLNAAAAVGLSMIIRARDFFWTILAIGILAYYGFNFRSAYTTSLKEGGLHPPKKQPFNKNNT